MLALYRTKHIRNNNCMCTFVNFFTAARPQVPPRFLVPRFLPGSSELIFHSDRGSQYASQEYRLALEQRGITASMSRKGNCWDNACAETLFGSLKVERLHGQHFDTLRKAKDETIAWLLWYNRTRLHSTLNYVSPIKFEQDWHEATTTVAA